MRNFFANKKLLFIILIVFAIIIFFSAYYIIPIIIKKATKNNLENQNREKTVFKQIDIKRFESITAELQVIFTDKNYWNEWSYSSHMVEARVGEVFPNTDEAIIYVTRPGNQSFTKKSHRVKFDCPLGKTIQVSGMNPTQTLMDGNFDIMEKIAKGDIIYSFCLDEGCLNLGRECILVKN